MAAAKAEAPPAPAAPPAKGDAAKGEGAAATAAPAAAPAKRSALGAWIPAIAALVLAPAGTWGAVQFVLLPRLQQQLSAPPPAAEAQPAAEAGGHGKGKEGKEGKDHGAGGPNFEFQNIVVNLAGTMGTRYLKTSFLVTGSDPGFKAAFEGKKPQLTDVTLNVLSALTLADLEEPGAKNVIREKLVGAYNQAFGRKVAEQVYFSDFVVQ